MTDQLQFTSSTTFNQAGILCDPGVSDPRTKSNQTFPGEREVLRLQWPLLEIEPACTFNRVSAYICSQYYICCTCPALSYPSFLPREQPSTKRKNADRMVTNGEDSSSEEGDSEEGTDEEEGGIEEAEESVDQEEACGPGIGEKLKQKAGPRRHVRCVVMKVEGRLDMFWVSFEGEFGRGRGRGPSVQDLEILVLAGCLRVTCVYH